MHISAIISKRAEMRYSMRKIKKTLDIIKETIDFKDGPLYVQLCEIVHSKVHSHDNALELLVCLKGSFSIYCNHEKITLSESEIYTIDKNDMHCIWSDVSNAVLIIHIDLSESSIYNKKLMNSYIACEDLSCHPFQITKLNEVKSILLSFAYKKYFSDMPSSKAYAVADRITDILTENFDWYSYMDQYLSTDKEIHERIIYVVNYCAVHYTEKLTISILAKALHMNENYFSQFFRHSPYGSFSQLVGFIRCVHATRFLLCSELSIVSIAQVCGFSDVKYMYKSFTYWWKMTPNEYRKWFSEYVKVPPEVRVITDSEAKELITTRGIQMLTDIII